MTLTRLSVDDLLTLDSSALPAEVAMVMSALEAGHQAKTDRRMTGRAPYRSVTNLRLFRDQPSPAALAIYTRDVNRRGLGFITPHRLPLGYGGIVTLPNEWGDAVSVHCTLLRCRLATPGWFEGSVYFNREQPHFDR